MSLENIRPLEKQGEPPLETVFLSSSLSIECSRTFENIRPLEKQGESPLEMVRFRAKTEQRKRF